MGRYSYGCLRTLPILKANLLEYLADVSAWSSSEVLSVKLNGVPCCPKGIGDSL